MYYYTWSHPYVLYLLFFLSPPPPPFFFPRVASPSGQLVFCCILIVFFCHARGSNLLYPPLSPPRRLSSMSNALYLDEICTHLSPKATPTFYAPHHLDTLE